METRTRSEWAGSLWYLAVVFFPEDLCIFFTLNIYSYIGLIVNARHYGVILVWPAGGAVGI